MYRDEDDGVRFRGVTDLSRGNLSCAAREPQTPFPACSILSFTLLLAAQFEVGAALHRRKRVAIRGNNFRGLILPDRTLCRGNVRGIVETRGNSDSY